MKGDIIGQTCKKHGVWFKIKDEKAECPMCKEKSLEMGEKNE